MKLLEKYKDPANFEEFSRMISSYILNGMDSDKIVKFLKEAYDEGVYTGIDGKIYRYAPYQKARLASLIFMVKEREIFEMIHYFRFDKIFPGRSFCEDYYGAYLSNSYHTEEKPSESCFKILKKMIEKGCDCKPVIASPKNREKMVCLNSEDGLYIYRHKEGYLVVAAINDANLGEITINEEPTRDGIPSYKAKEEQFISPVFTSNVMTNILEWVLARFGFLNVGVFPEVIFSHYKTELTNKKEHEINPQYIHTWGRTRVYERSRNTGKYILSGLVDIRPYSIDELDDIDNILYGSIGAASIIYSSLRENPAEMELLIERKEGEKPSYCDFLEKRAHDLGLIKTSL